MENKKKLVVKLDLDKALEEVAAKLQPEQANNYCGTSQFNSAAYAGTKNTQLCRCTCCSFVD
jgi:hypothetical protein